MYANFACYKNETAPFMMLIRKTIICTVGGAFDCQCDDHITIENKNRADAFNDKHAKRKHWADDEDDVGKKLTSLGHQKNKRRRYKSR